MGPWTHQKSEFGVLLGVLDRSKVSRLVSRFSAGCGMHGVRPPSIAEIFDIGQDTVIIYVYEEFP